MNKDYYGLVELLDLCDMLASSQGFYGRLRSRIYELSKEEKITLDNYLKSLKLTSQMDLILALES